MKTTFEVNAAETGAYLRGKLEELKEKHTVIGDVRGMGLMQALELVEDRSSKQPAAGCHAGRDGGRPGEPHSHRQRRTCTATCFASRRPSTFRNPMSMTFIGRLDASLSVCHAPNHSHTRV